MDIAVIIATAGRPRLLAQALEALSQQSFPGGTFEVSVVIDGPDPESERGVGEAAARFTRLSVQCHEKRRGPAVARNRAVAATSAPLLAITDDDCLVSPGWLAAIRSAFAGDDSV